MAFVQSVSVLQAAASMPGLAPGAAVATVFDAGRIKGNWGGTGAGNAAAPEMQFSISGITGA
jgi:hypothetical protein